MVDCVEKVQEHQDAIGLIIPYSSRGRWLGWTRERFRLRNRRFFWCAFVLIAAVILLTSHHLLNIVVFLPLYALSLIIKTPVEQLMNSSAMQGINDYIHNLSSSGSPMDSVLSVGFTSAQYVILFPGAENFYALLGTGAAIVWIVLFVRMSRTPAYMRLTGDGLSLAWSLPFGILNGPIIPWSDIIMISLKRYGGDNSPDGKLDIHYGTSRWQYKLGQKTGELKDNKFTVDLSNLESLEQRQALGKYFQEHAPLNTVQPEVVEILSATQSQAYTELWLQALTSPSKRQSLEPLPSGKALRNGKYEIVGQLGVGGQGTAYDARSEGGSIVVKEFVLPLYVDTNSRKEALRRFLDEADLLKRLDHNRVVKLAECFVEDHRGYLVMERIHGQSLRQSVLKNGAMTESNVLELLDQMIDVLSYLHSQQPPVVHRDFAPDNLILGDDGVLKLVDFNVAQQTDNTMTGTIVGKQSYVPPEQLRGMATPASDIYALGATLHFLLTGADPEPLSVSRPRQVRPYISQETDDLIAGCTQLDEGKRFNSVEQIRDRLSTKITWRSKQEHS